MPFPAWTDIGSSREKETNAAPLVSIFGAGIAGLSLAHELVERGMAVQVFEAKSDPDEEYSCQVGGLAANQLARIPANAMRLHPHLYPEQPGAEEPITPIARTVLVWIAQDLTQDLAIEIDGQLSPTILAGATAKGAAGVIASFADGLPGIDATQLPTSPPEAVLISATDEYRLLDVSLFQPDTAGPVPRLRSPDARWEQVRHLGLLRDAIMQRAQPRFPLPHRLQFERTAYVGNAWIDFLDNLGIANRDKLAVIWTTLKQAYTTYRRLRAERIDELTADATLDFYLSDRMRRREELCVELRGHADGSGTKLESRALAQKWVESVRDELVDRNTAEGNPIPQLAERLVLLAIGDAEPIGNPRTRAGRRRNDRVEVRIVENVLPAEHGYRYFPCFYRHLFDTMRRTPILDDSGRESGETAYDQLVSTPATDVALSRDRVPVPGCRDDIADANMPEKNDPEALPTGSPLSLEDLRALLRIHLERMHICERDILQFQFRLLKFLTASDARRRTWEKLSWLEFLGADVPGRYSRRMVQLLMDTPQALLAMNAAETDAHTQGLISCQLLLDALREGANESLTLNGPTSQAWLDQWKRYLRRQGVRFYNARLESLDWTPAGELIPKVTIFTGVGPSVTAYLVDSDGVDISIDGIRIVQAMPGLNPSQQVGPLIHLLRADFGGLEISLPDVVQGGSAALPVTARPRSALLTFGADGDTHVVINGSNLLATGSSPKAVRDDLLAQLLAADFDAFAVGQDSLRLGVLDPHEGPARAMVSVGEAVAGETYGVRLGADVFEVVALAASREEVRDQLLEELRMVRRREFLPVGATGIRIDQMWRPHEVDVSDWEPRMRLGPIVDDVPPSVEVAVRTTVEVSVHAAIPDVSMQSSVADPILPDPTGMGGSDYYVLAVPYEEASRLVWDAWDQRPTGGVFDGVFEQLLTFDERTGRRDATGAAVALQRDASGRPIPAWWPLRDLSGIQFYFDHQVRLGHGHTYFVDSPWGLSSISQLTYWRQRMSQASPFLGQVSVDIGHWYRAVERVDDPVAPTEHIFHPEAWRSTRREIADEVWRQLLAGTHPRVEEHIVKPTWYHIDEGIRFEPTDPADARRAFSRPAVVSETAAAGPISLRLGGVQVDVAGGSSAALVAAIEAKTDHLAHAFPEVTGLARVAIAPVAERVNSLRIVVGIEGPPTAAVTFRVSVNLADHPGTVASYAYQAGDTLDKVRQAIVAAVMSTLPGVVAETEPKQHGEDVARGIRLRSTQPMRVSVIGFDGETPLVWTNPSGGLEIEPLVKAAIENAAARATPIANATPFLINTPDRGNVRIWGSRPGVRPAPDAEKGPYFYDISLSRWLMVGNHMATHTRLSTMESANESARHAAIAILHHLMDQPNGELFGRTPELWPPSEHEIPDARPFKRLDERLMEAAPEALPHFLDILKIGDWLDALPHDLPPVPDDEKLKELLAFARKQVQTDWRFTQLDELEKLLPAALEALIGP